MPRSERIDSAPDMRMSQHVSPLTIKNAVRDTGLSSYPRLYRAGRKIRREANQASGGRNIGGASGDPSKDLAFLMSEAN